MSSKASAIQARLLAMQRGDPRLTAGSLDTYLSTIRSADPPDPGSRFTTSSMPSTLPVVHRDTVSTSGLMPFEHSDVPKQFWLIDLSREALDDNVFTYTICYYEVGGYEGQRTYSVSGLSYLDSRVIKRILLRNLSSADSEFASFAKKIGCTDSYRSDLLDWIAQIWSKDVNEECSPRLFCADVEGN